MKHFYLILTLASLVGASVPVSAQISIDEVNAERRNVTFRDRLKSTSVDADYFSLARYKAERAAIRKERNYLEFGGGLQGALTSYNDPWIATSGGDNSIALVATFNLKHIFTKDLFTIETKFNAKLGYNRMKVTVDDKEEGIWFKNQDEFEISTAPSFKMTKNWSYGVIAKFRSQFVNGYKSRTEQEEADLKSKFMTPAYLDISLGITYKSPEKKFPITVNMSPLAMNATFAENDWIRKRQVDKDGNEIKPAYPYGIEDPDRTSKYEGGSSVQIDFDRTFGKTGYLRYRTMLYGFYGWISDIGQRNKISDYSKYLEAFEKWNAGDKNIKDKPRLPIHPIVRWTNTIDIKATRFLSTTLSFELYYNRAQNVDVQTKTLLSVGLTYTFKNK
ncbi:DUF3078 domain-containing protein [Alistipes shahii]|jgi:hypothetical protein|uniref:DUF3078 domain-containing protein n=1 Tax=Alistipes shahii TaxID=328814 RepID=UPI0026DD7302|nr:DUF3078 domain-containing protein [Alistipes shahii]